MKSIRLFKVLVICLCAFFLLQMKTGFAQAESSYHKEFHFGAITNMFYGQNNLYILFAILFIFVQILIIIALWINIAKRKRAEKRLEDEKRRLFTAFDILPGFVYLQSRDYSIKLTNSKFHEVFGNPDGKACHELIHGRSEPCEECPTFKVFETQEPQTWVNTTKDGRTFMVYDQPYPGLGDEEPMVLEMALEITDLKKAKETLRENEEHLSTVYKAADNVAFVTTDLAGEDTLILDFSPGAEKIFGYSAKEIIGEKVAILHTPETVKDFPAMQQTLREGGKGHSGEATLLRKSGEKFPAIFTIHPRFDTSGKLVGTVGVSIDISNLKNAQKEIVKQEYYLRKAQELGKIGTWEFDIAKNKLTWTDENYRIFGIPFGSKLNYETFLNTVHPDDRDFVNNEWKTGVENKEYDIEHRVIVDSKTKWIHEKAEIICDKNGNAIRAIGFSHDITDLKESEEELQKMRKLKSIGILAGGIAHDFNNILMGIYANISMAKLGLQENQSSFDYLEKAEKSMDRATRLTNQLLTFAQGGAPLREDVDLGVIIEETTQFNLSGSNVKPIFNIPEKLWMANVDKGQMHQVFSNIIINANQAMPNGGNVHLGFENIEFTEKTVPGLSKGRYVKVTVRDEGIGIDQRHIESIFDPYFSTKQMGSGLGLATAYSIVSRHGGHISVDSKLGKGTIFTLFLPASKSLFYPNNAEAEKPVLLKPSNKSKILIMDDEEIILSSVKSVLKEFGYSVDTARDGKESATLYKQAIDSKAPFDVVIMDLTVPGGMGGEFAIRELLKIDPKVKAIVSSGYANDPIMANYAKYGFKGIIAKPYTPDKLREVLEEVLMDSTQ